jgi:predicted GNAT family acetyltransferase
MTDTRLHATVKDDPERQVFRAVLDDGAEAGVAYYDRSQGIVTFTRTEVDPAFEGRGVGSQLAGGALGMVRARGERFVWECPFIRAYVERHPEYADLRAE